MFLKGTFKQQYTPPKNKGILHTIKGRTLLLSLISPIASGTLSSMTTRKAVGKPSASPKKKQASIYQTLRSLTKASGDPLTMDEKVLTKMKPKAKHIQRA